MTSRGLRFATWNLHSCVNRDGRFDPDTTHNALMAIDPDIASLQEVDSRAPLAGDVDTFAYLRDRLERHACETRTIRTAEGDYGHMLLSRWPFESCRVHDLSVPGREPRHAIEAVVETPEGSVRIISTHLGLRRAERRRQLRTLRLIADADRVPTVLMGDFNELRVRGTAHAALSPSFLATPGHRTYPSAIPLLPLDRLWYQPPLDLEESWVVREAGYASDHLPLVADLHMRDDA